MYFNAVLAFAFQQQSDLSSWAFKVFQLAVVRALVNALAPLGK